MNLKDKVAIVTGGSKGIGLETIKFLLNKEVKVACWSRSKPPIEDPDLYFFSTDVGNSESVHEAYIHTKDQLGENIDILVNNAGLGFESDFEKLSAAHWHQMFRTNVDSIFYCSGLVIPKMKENDSGHIINISSIAGLQGIERLAGYCGTKFAVRGLSHAMYKELRRFGIKVTCIYPGSVKTNFFDDIDSVTTHDNMMMPEDIAETIIHVLESSPNYHHIDIEVRPLKPKG